MLGLIRPGGQVDYAACLSLTFPRKLDGFQVEDFAFLGPSILTERANSTGVRLPIEPWGRGARSRDSRWMWSPRGEA